jgi:hypothetical protein
MIRICSEVTHTLQYQMMTLPSALARWIDRSQHENCSERIGRRSPCCISSRHKVGAHSSSVRATSKVSFAVERLVVVFLCGGAPFGRSSCPGRCRGSVHALGSERSRPHREAAGWEGEERRGAARRHERTTGWEQDKRHDGMCPCGWCHELAWHLSFVHCGPVVARSLGGERGGWACSGEGGGH